MNTATEQLKIRHVSAAPCVDCGTTGGRIPENQYRPVRLDGTRFGFNGGLCDGCYERHRNRVRRLTKIRSVGPKAPEPPPVVLRMVIPPRVAAVRAVKQAKERVGLAPLLTDEELDAVLPMEGHAS